MDCCFDCGRDFSNDLALRQHLRDSPAHAPSFDCDDCDRSFASEDALQQRQSNSKVHSQQRVHSLYITYRSPKPDKESAETDKRTKYNGVSPSLITPVYKLAVRLRREYPSVEDIVLATGTSLESPIVTALLNAAERLNSLSESREDAQRRTERQKQRSLQAQRAEDAFVECFSRHGFRFATEVEQRQQAELVGQRPSPTPDMRFTSPVMICGLPCSWLEFKDYFGFSDNPFVSSSEKTQLKRYVHTFGPGAVGVFTGISKQLSKDRRS